METKLSPDAIQSFVNRWAYIMRVTKKSQKISEPNENIMQLGGCVMYCTYTKI
jgi:hypothetical protein